MESVAGPVATLSALPDPTAIATNVTVLVTFVGIVVAGIMAGIKKVKELAGDKPPAQLAAATILENVTLSEWSKTNREVATQLAKLCDILTRHSEDLVNHRHESAELRLTLTELMMHLKHRGTNHDRSLDSARSR